MQIQCNLGSLNECWKVNAVKEHVHSIVDGGVILCLGLSSPE